MESVFLKKGVQIPGVVSPTLEVWNKGGVQRRKQIAIREGGISKEGEWEMDDDKERAANHKSRV